MSSTPGADIRVVFREDQHFGMLWRDGWGIRPAPGGRSCNPRGQRGTLLTLVDGRTLPIGSQRSAELAAAIEHELTGATTSGRGPLRGAP
jgi:hypothetical protein